MSVIHFQPWHLVNHLQRDIERRVARDNAHATHNQADNQASEWTPAIDVRETPADFVLSADLPGVNPKDIEVTMENGLLTIRGARSESDAGTTEQNSYRRVERVNGRFLRQFTLPESVDTEAVTAKTHHGVLTLTIPKRLEVQPRRIEIQAA
jgi:HSP20 family protein